MARVDHPDPAAANAQALHDLENGATGLTLVCAGSINANGYGIDGSAETLARVLDGVFLDAGIVIDFNVSPETRGIVRHFAALVKQRNIAPAAVELRASINPIGGMAAAGGSAQALERARARLRQFGDRRTRRTGLSRAVRGRRRADRSQRRRLGGAGTGVRDRQRGRLPARPRSRPASRSMRRAA